MNTEITTFLNSDLLEKYLIGQTTVQETITVEHYIKTYPEVEKTYKELQNKLELVAITNSQKAPLHILGNIFEDIKEQPIPVVQPKIKKSWFAYGIAASVAALIFAGTSLFFYNKNLQLLEENQTIVDEIFDLRDDISNNNSKLDDLSKRFSELNNPETEKYVLKGNERAKNLKTVAYINPKEKKSMVDVVSLPILPEGKEYQIWAELQDKMVSLGVLSETDRRMQEIPYTEDALGLSITIEERNSNNTLKPKETPVAEIELKIND